MNAKLERTKHIYVILNHVNKLYKIGISEDVQKRIGNLISGSGCDMSLIYKSDRLKDAIKYESEIHSILGEFRRIGEWFDAKEDVIIKTVEKVCKKAEIDEIVLMYRKNKSVSDIQVKTKLSRSGIIKHLEQCGEWKENYTHSDRSIKKQQIISEVKNVFNPLVHKRISANTYSNTKKNEFLYMEYLDGKFIEYLFTSLDELEVFKTELDKSRNKK